MIKNLFLLFAFLLSFTSTQAQKKIDLLNEIATLKSVIDSVKGEFAISRKKEIVSKTEADSYKAQTDELLETNKSLMQNINNFTLASIEKSENIGKTLQRLRDKETQLKNISDKFSSHDSIALLVLTDFKKTLGENANINVSGGAIIVSLKQATRDGFTSKDATQKATAEGVINKIASVIKTYKDSNIVVEASTNTGEFDIALNQATLLVNKFLKLHSINANRISATAKDGGFSEGMNIKVYPKFDAFYFELRGQMKEVN
jgi:flagellar motor protein MotB